MTLKLLPTGRESARERETCNGSDGIMMMLSDSEDERWRRGAV